MKPLPRAPRAHSGFTLIELLIVVLVLSSLIAVAAPSFLAQAGKAKDSAAQQGLAVALKAAKANAVDRDGAWGAAAALAAAIEQSEPQLEVSSGSAFPAQAATGERTNINISVAGTTLELRARSAADKDCLLRAPENGAAQMLACTSSTATAGGTPFTIGSALAVSSPPSPAYPVAGGWATSGQIVFLDDRTGVNQVRVVNGDGTGDAALTTSGTLKGSPRWSPSGQKLLYDDAGELIVADAGGLNPLSLSSGLTGAKQDAIWSPSSAKLAFVHSDGSGPHLLIVDVGGLNRTELPSGGSNGIGNPRFSPDGSTLSFGCSTVAAGWGICTVGSDGSGFVRRFATNAAGRGADWVSSSRLIFEQDGVIKAANLDGSSAVVVINAAPGVVLSPDRSALAFGSWPNIWVVNVDASQLTNVTNFPAGQEGEQPVWSADSAKLVFTRYITATDTPQLVTVAVR